MTTRAQVREGRGGSLARFAERLQLQYPALAGGARWREFVAERSAVGPCLHLDDFSAIRAMLGADAFACLHDRARLRAGEGDAVASILVPEAGYEPYCRARLGLGNVTWVHPRAGLDARQLAMACWRDATIRRWLIDAFRDERLIGIHPYMGTRHVFELARLLRDATGRRIPVIAPPPALCTWVNDKIAFAETVRRLFGPAAAPRTLDAASLAILAHRVLALADACSQIVVKIPDAAGGRGNLVLDAASFRGRPLGVVRRAMRTRLANLGWDGTERLLVGRWEEDVLAAPSVQTWIPPACEGGPVIDGVFEQRLEGSQQRFVGVGPAALPGSLVESMRDQCRLLAGVYQALGYLGRCSFDLLVTGPSLDEGRAEFIECNGRWGGTSLPMALMDRLLGDHDARAWIADTVELGSAPPPTFARVLDALDESLFDVSVGREGIIPFNPGALSTAGVLHMVVMGATPEDVELGSKKVRGRLLARLGRTKNSRVQ